MEKGEPEEKSKEVLKRAMFSFKLSECSITVNVSVKSVANPKAFLYIC